jgi:hypothetical protein
LGPQGDKNTSRLLDCRVYSSALRQIHQWGTFEVPLALTPQDYEMNEHREIWAIRYVNQSIRFLSLSYASLIHQYISFILKNGINY